MTRETLRRIIFPALVLLACVPAAFAQEEQPKPTPQPTPLTAPPPFKMIVKEERAEISKQLQRKSACITR